MTPEQWARLTPQQQAQQIAQYGPPPAHFTATAPSVTSPYSAAPPARRQSRKGLWVGIGVFVGLFILIAAANASKNAPPTTTTASSGVPAVEAAAAAAPAPAAPAGPATSVGDGTYQVGVDMAAGRYKTPGAPSDGLGICYWERDRNDSGQFDAIISNDVFKGPGSVTVKNGEFAKLSGDCSWTKQ